MKNTFTLTSGPASLDEVQMGKTLHFKSGVTPIDFIVKKKLKPATGEIRIMGHTNPGGKKGAAGTIVFSTVTGSGKITYR